MKQTHLQHKNKSDCFLFRVPLCYDTWNLDYVLSNLCNSITELSGLFSGWIYTRQISLCPRTEVLFCVVPRFWKAAKYSVRATASEARKSSRWSVWGHWYLWALLCAESKRKRTFYNDGNGQCLHCPIQQPLVVADHVRSGQCNCGTEF